MAGLLKAIRLNNVDVVEKKLKKGHDPNKHKEEQDVTKKIKCTTIPLCLAAAKGYTQIVSKLIEYGADIHASNSDWSTPMHLATFNGHADTMRVLIVNNVRLDTKDSPGNTALHVAAKKSNYECVQLLLKNGADPNATNVSGKTPLDIAHDDDIVDLLLNGSDALQFERLGSFGSASDDDVEHTSIRVPGYRNSLLFIEDTDFTKTPPPYFTNTNNEKEALLRQLHAIEREEVTNELRQKETELMAVEGVISQTYDDAAAVKMKMKALEDRLQQCKQILQEHEDQRAQLKKNIVMLELKRNGTLIETTKDDTPDESYECPICLKVPLPPVQVFQCLNGHIYCGICRTQPTMKRCRECRVSVKKNAIRNIRLEEIIRKHYNPI